MSLPQTCGVTDPEADKKMRLMIQSAISRYMEIMGPKLHSLVEQIVARQTVDKSADQVHHFNLLWCGVTRAVSVAVSDTCDLSDAPTVPGSAVDWHAVGHFCTL